MNPMLKSAKIALILLALTIMLALIVVIGLAKYHTEKKQSLWQAEQQLASTRENIRKLTFDLNTINKLTKKYRRLSQIGFIGEPNRDSWVQGLEAIYRDTHLPPTLRYSLAPAQLFNPQAQPKHTPSAYLNNVLHHDLALELSGIHAGEFLDFMARLNLDWQAPYRVNTCRITRKDEVRAGLQINCTVQLYSLPDKTIVRSK
ncbi:MAG: hypothetical protein R8K48_01180 [Gallionella sp.]